ncbi:hypothetical protein [Terrimonas alba]|uniref:hypothetical protein n=1 Tax=Terrimonas alba TaxID=3349636 RepID=UPI0035F3813B
MSLSLDEYRCKLINAILFAGSQQEVRRFCESALEELEHDKIDDAVITRFTNQMIGELEQFNPMNKDAQQWSNITMARIYFNRMKHRFHVINSANNV